MLSSSFLARASSPGDFTVVALPDPQNYTQLVLEVGDSVNNALDPTQWQNADHLIVTLDQTNVPYAIAIGNHDYDTLPPTTRKASCFNQHFSPSRYSAKPYYGASNFPSGSNENFYETFTWGGKSYLILVLEYVPRASSPQKSVDPSVTICSPANGAAVSSQ